MGIYTRFDKTDLIKTLYFSFGKKLAFEEKNLKMMKIPCLAVAMMMLLFACKKNNSDNQPALPSIDTTVRNVSYGNNPANILDLYLPQNRTNSTKLIVLIHGGGWNAGDKNELAFFADGFKARGFAVVNINYRLSPQSTDNYNMQLDDIAKAVDFLNIKASYYKFNNGTYYIMGHSAGAHLALSYAYVRNGNGKIRAVAGLASPTDLFAGATENFGIVGSTTIAPYLGGPLNPSSEAKYKDASPIYHVTKATVPTILFQGNADLIVPLSQATSLDNKLKQNGVAEKLIVYPGVSHNWWGNANLVKNTLDETAAWFNKY